MHIYAIVFIIVGTVLGITIFARCYMCCCPSKGGVAPPS